jgi:hypothetical protein
VDSFERDVQGEEEELDRDQLLGTLLGHMREQAAAAR